MSRAGWESKKLGEVCSFLNRGISPKYLESGGISVLNQRCIRDHQINFDFSRRHDLKAKKIGTDKLVRAGDVLVNSTGTGTLGRVAQLREEPSEPTTVDSHVTIVRPIPGKFYSDFFGYVLRDIEPEIQGSGDGCGGQIELARTVLAEKFIVRYPTSLSQQQHIVHILDNAFAHIATAKANAEKNLQNARAVFESHLQAVFSQRGNEWTMEKLDNLTELARGQNPPKKVFSREQKAGYVRFYQIRDGGTDDYTVYVPDSPQLHKMKKDDIMMVAYRHVGRVFRGVEGAFNVALCKIRNARKDLLDDDYLFNIIPSKFIKGELLKRSERSLIPSMSIEHLRELEIPLPPIKEQQEIVRRINILKEGTQHLESLCQRRLSALDALKKSLLHSAFSGKLSSSSSRTQVLIPFPTKIPDISPTDLHAGILAIAYQFHKSNDKLENYGHVKAEKIAHMVEAYLGIDLDRNPIKDAAGPNDYPHSRKVEHRARMAGYFDFQPTELGRYQVKKLPGFDKLILRTREKLGDRIQGVIDLMNLMVGMRTQQAEIFATVHAAWNNLLLESKPVSDEAIVLEARENWHPDKMKIPREKFFAAIQWIKEKDLVPKGIGKFVAAKT